MPENISKDPLTRLVKSGAYASLSAKAQAVVTVWRSFYNFNTGLFWPSVRTVTKMTGLPKARVEEGIAELEDKGIVYRAGRKVRSIVRAFALDVPCDEGKTAKTMSVLPGHECPDLPGQDIQKTNVRSYQDRTPCPDYPDTDVRSYPDRSINTRLNLSSSESSQVIFDNKTPQQSNDTNTDKGEGMNIHGDRSRQVRRIARALPEDMLEDLRMAGVANLMLNKPYRDLAWNEQAAVNVFVEQHIDANYATYEKYDPGE